MAIVNWSKLNAIHGGQTKSFEALCNQLAVKDPRWSGCRFQANGDPDGGLECFWTDSGGRVHGYQAKYFLASPGQTQWTELDRSFKKALKSYKTLATVTFCMPLDLPHAPVEKKGAKSKTVSARQKWEKLVARWKDSARTAGINDLEITLWDKMSLDTLLAEPTNAPIRQYFFGEPRFDQPSLHGRLKTMTERAGHRYQPSLHVRHETESVLEWLALSQQFRKAIASKIRLMAGSLTIVPDLPDAAHRPALEDACNQAREEIESLAARVEKDTGEDALRASKDLFGCLESLEQVIAKVRHELLPKRASQLETYEGFRLGKWQGEIRDAYEKWLESVCMGNAPLAPRLDAAQRRGVELVGGGGSGKTHVLCERALRLSEQGVPVVLAYGHQNPLTRLSTSLSESLGVRLTLREILEQLNVAGAISGCRALLILDGLNEADDSNRWDQIRADLLAELKTCPHVSLIASMRDDTTLVQRTPDPDAVPVIRHRGFDGNTQQLLARYCGHYGIAVPDMPDLDPAFDSPLFVSIFCKAIGQPKEQRVEGEVVPFADVPADLTQAFDRYLKYQEAEMRRLHKGGSDTSETPLIDALEACAEAMLDNSGAHLPLNETKTILTQHLCGFPTLTQPVGFLESQGLLRKQYVVTESTGKDQIVRFEYDRLGSHLMAKALLREVHTTEQGKSLFGSSGELKRLPFAASHWRSVAAEFIAQWQSRFGESLFQSVPATLTSWEWQSVLVLQAAETPGIVPTRELARAVLTGTFRLLTTDIERASRLWRMLSRSGSEALSGEIHEHLLRLNLSQRDLSWNAELINDDFTRYPAFIDWALERHASRIPPERAKSYLRALGWLTGLTHREHRSRATKAIVAILEASDLRHGAWLLKQFKTIDDLWVLASVTLGIYAACQRSGDSIAVIAVADAVMECFPDKKKWPVDLWVRHALAGIVELAVARHGYRIELDRVRPPYESDWPTNVPSWDVLDKRAKSADLMEQRAYCLIHRSCQPNFGERHYGDFGRYVVESACGVFCPTWRTQGSRPFEADFPHRFILERVRTLGWRPELFAGFDWNVSSHDRQAASVERVGKKYQWIALYEFLARATDRLPLQGSFSSDRDKKTSYVGPLELTSNPLGDASILRTLQRPDHHEPGQFWWVPTGTGPLWRVASHREWIESAADYLDPEDLITVRDEAGITWTTVAGRYTVKQRQPGREEFKEAVERVSWMHIMCYLVTPEELEATVQRLLKNNEQIVDLDKAPTVSMAMLGELYWCRSFKAEIDQIEREQKIVVTQPVTEASDRALMPAALEYMNEYEASEVSSVYRFVPSPYFAGALELRASSTDFAFVDRGGTIVAQNPGAEAGGPNVCLVRGDALANACRDLGRVPIWFTIAQKQVYRLDDRDDIPFRIKTVVIWKEDGEFRIRSQEGAS